MSITRFELPAAEPAASDVRLRLRAARWPDEIAGPAGVYGVDLSTLRALCDYWRERFDWSAQLAALSRFDHRRFEHDGLGVHFVYAPSGVRGAIPLILTHGWPGSFLEMLEVVPLLTAADGADGRAVFDVVVPSLPGFGFSDRPFAPGMHCERIADLWAALMAELGYARFAVQGGDFGASVATFLALRHPTRVVGVHLNYIPGSYRPWISEGDAPSQDEADFLDQSERWALEFGGYAHVQSREPQTLACALNDSPIGLAAWILEKFRLWADCGGVLSNRFTADELLTNVMLYWTTQTIASSCRLYLEQRLHPVHMAAGERVETPCAIARFPFESPFPPRSWVERGYNVCRWTEMPRGGHFAAMEEPELLAADIRAFFGGLVTNT